MTVGMRVALKIAYDGRAFYGHQRQPYARTVEGECLRALRSAAILRDTRESFFRSASRTDRGVSAVGNVIAFNASFSPEAVVGAFNDRARDVWAWAVASVPNDFHPRHAVERWYRYYLADDVPLPLLREAAAWFPRSHDFRSFTSDPPRGPFSISSIDVSRETETVLVDVRAPSFRRGMVRRIIAAMISYASQECSADDIRAALRGTKRDFGVAPPEPLVLMDVRYDLPFRVLLKPKVRDEWRAIAHEVLLRKYLVDAWTIAARDSE